MPSSGPRKTRSPAGRRRPSATRSPVTCFRVSRWRPPTIFGTARWARTERASRLSCPASPRGSACRRPRSAGCWGCAPGGDRPGGWGGGRGLPMPLGYDEQRQRGDTAPAPAETLASGANRTLSVTTSFSPTRNWNLSWQTQYNFTTNEFGQHTLRLERDPRRWRATFDFLKSPNGNFAFSFHIVLLDQSDIKFNYDQRT